MNRCVAIALFAFAFQPLCGFGQCPLKQDSITDRFGNARSGTISDKEVWPNMRIDVPGRGTFTTRHEDVVEIKWEGVTNAKLCYFDPGIAAYRDGRTLFDMAARVEGLKQQKRLRARSLAKFQEATNRLSKIKPAANRFHPGMFEDAQKYIGACKKMLAAGKPAAPKPAAKAPKRP